MGEEADEVLTSTDALAKGRSNYSTVVTDSSVYAKTLSSNVPTLIVGANLKASW